MWPAIRDSERILIAPVRAPELRVGDIIQSIVTEDTRVQRQLGRGLDSSGARVQEWLRDARRRRQEFEREFPYSGG